MMLIETNEIETMTEFEGEYEYTYITQKKERMRQRLEAIFKVADGENPRCAVCGCPHAEILQFGHFNGNGSYHRQKVGKGMILWILRNTIETIREKIRLECPYCNFWHGVYNEYPAPEKRPYWGESGIYPREEQTSIDSFVKEEMKK